MPNPFQSVFSYTFKGEIWKIYAPPSGNVLLIEERDAHLKEVNFSCLDLETFQFFWKDISFGDKWWTGVADLTETRVFFQKFSNPHRPEMSQIIAVDLLKGEIIWHNTTHQFWGLDASSVIGIRYEKGNIEYEKLSWESGIVVEQLDKTPIFIPNSSAILTPQRYEEESAYFQTVKSFLQKKFNLDVFGRIDYLEYQNLIIIAHFLKENEGMSIFLLIFDTNVQILLHHCINQNIQNVYTDNFCVVQQKLITIENQHIVRIFLL